MFLYLKKKVIKQVFFQYGEPWYRSVAWCIFSWPCNPHSPKEPSMPNRCCDIQMTSPIWILMGCLLFLEDSNPIRKRFKIYKISSKVNFFQKQKHFLLVHRGKYSIHLFKLRSYLKYLHGADTTDFKNFKKSGQSKRWSMRYNQKSSGDSLCTILTPAHPETQLLALYKNGINASFFDSIYLNPLLSGSWVLFWFKCHWFESSHKWLEHPFCSPIGASYEEK